MKELETLHSIGKLITSLLDLDELLTRVVEASVDITGAEEGYLLLVDEGTGELYLRAQQNLGEEHARGFRLKVHDSIAGSVVKAGKPEIAESKEGKSLKIKTGYQVKALLNVPLKVREKVIGVLGVNNKVSDKAFSEDNLYMLSILADYAAIAIEKARLFSQLTETKERLNGLIASSLDAVIAVDQDKKITVFNQAAEEMFGWTAEEMEGRSVARLHMDFGKAEEIHEVLDREGTVAGWQIALKHKDGTRIPALLSATLIRDSQGNPIGQAGFMRDLRQANLLEERLRALIRVSQAITVTLELDKVLDLIVESAVAAFPTAQSGTIHLYDERTDTLRVRAITYDYTADAIEALSLRVGEKIAGWVFQNQQPLVVGDAGQAPRYKRIDHPEVQDHKSMVCMPLRVKEKAIGALTLSNNDVTGAFRAEDLGLLSIFASQAAVAIINAELMTKSRERLGKLEMLSWASNEMMSNLHSLSLDDRLNLIVRHAAQILDAETSTIFLVKRPGFLSKEASHGHRKGGFHKGREFAIRSGKGTGLIGHIAYTGELFNAHGDDLVGHWATTGRAPDHVASGKCCSLLAIPLKRQLGDTKELVGLLDVENKKDTDGQPKSHIGFSKEDEWILSIFAKTVVICLENAELYERTSDRLEEKVATLKAIQETSAAISAELDLDELLELITEKAAAVFAAPAASLMLWDNREENLVVRAKHGLTDEYTQQRVPREKVDDAIVLMGELRPFPTVDLRSTPFGRLDLIEAEHLCSVLSAPLAVSGRLIGILDIYSKDEPRQFTADETEVVEVLASQAAVAIRNAQLYEETIRRANALEVLYEAGKAVTGTLALDEILSRIVEQAWRITGRYSKQARFSDLALEEGHRLKFKAACPPEYLLGLQQELGDIDLEYDERIGIKGRVVKTGRSQLVGDVTQDPDYVQYDPETRSELAVPIKLGKEVIGVINVEHPDYNAFDEDDRRDLESLAAQASIAIQNARQFRLREGLLKAGEVVTVEGELYPALEVIAESVKETIGCDVVCLCTYYEKRREVSYPSVVVGELRKPQEQADWQLISQERRLPVDLLGERSVVNKLLEYGSSRFAFCSAKDSILGTGGFVAREGIESSAGILLKVGEEVMGILFVNYRSPHHFSEQERQATELFAYQAAVTIRNAQLYEETTRRATTLEALYQASRAVTSTLTLDELLDHVVEQAWRLAEPRGGKTHFSHLALTDGNYIKFAAAHPPETLSTLQEKINLKSDVPIGITGRVVLTGQSQLVGNVLEDHDYIETDPHVRSQLSVPIQMGEQVIGVIGVEHPDYEAFDKEDRHALEALAAQAAIAIENARLYEQTTQWLSELETLQQVCVSLTETLELHTVLDRVMQAAIQLTGAHEGNILLYNRKREEFTDTLTCPGPGQSLRPYLSQVRQRGGYSHTIVQQGQPVVIPDTHLDPSVNPVSIAKGRRAWVGVPLPGREGAIGVLWVTWRVPRHFSQHEVSLLVALASQAAVAIENARQYEELKQTRGIVGTMTAVAWMGTVAGAWRHAIGTYITTIEDLVKLIRLDLRENLSASKIKERLIGIEEVTSEIRKIPMPPLSMEAGVESVFINQLIAERINQLQERKGRYEAVTYETDFALDDAATVRASPEWLRRVLDILVDNAVDTMADTLIKRLTIVTRPADAGVEIAIIDTGRGVPRDVLPKLFLEPIKKLKGAKGSGLGLFLARTVVQTYGGKLDIRSTGPTGTTMVIWLPVEA